MRQDYEASEGVVAHWGVEEATWELEHTVRANYPFLFEGEGIFLVIWH